MTDAETVERLSGDSGPAVVDLWAPWCGPCRAVSPALERLATEFRGRVELVKVNVDQEPDAAQAFGVLGIPTILGMHGGRVVARQVGAAPEAVLRRVFEAALHGAPTDAGTTMPERALRLAAGAGLAAIGWAAGRSTILMGIGLLVGASAVADRCPLWRTVAGALGRRRTAAGSTRVH